MGFDIVNSASNDQFPVGKYWWVTLADYSRYIAPSVTAACRYWYTNNGDGLNADQAHKLGAELQRSVDDCTIYAYAQQLFGVLCKERSVPDFVQFDQSDFTPREFPKHEQERRFVNEFVSEVQRFIEFLLACDGFEIL
ncbi:hypothetical protein ABIF90_003706 [Bradyrhizobium japonicum]